MPQARTHYLNPKRWLQFQAACRALEAFKLERAAELSCETHPDVGYGVIQLRASAILWHREQRFSMEILHADNFEIYPVNDITIQMDLMFYGITVKIAED